MNYYLPSSLPLFHAGIFQPATFAMTRNPFCVAALRSLMGLLGLDLPNLHAFRGRWRSTQGLLRHGIAWPWVHLTSRLSNEFVADRICVSTLNLWGKNVPFKMPKVNFRSSLSIASTWSIRWRCWYLAVLKTVSRWPDRLTPALPASWSSRICSFSSISMRFNSSWTTFGISLVSPRPLHFLGTSSEINPQTAT